MDLNEAKNIKEQIVKDSDKGFGSFFKNITLVLLIFIIMFIATHPELILNPSKFMSGINSDIIYVIGVLFLLISAAYQLAVSINKDNKMNQSKIAVEEFKIAEREEKSKQEEDHSKLVNKRIESSPLIRNELKDVLIKLGASRVSVCEMHNGTNNLAGIPFLYLDMTYEEKTPSVDYITDEYRNFNMAKYPFIPNHLNNGSWVGSLEEVAKEDGHLTSKLTYGNSKYGGFVVLRGKNSIIGFLCVAFDRINNLPSKAEILSTLSSSAQVISSLLDKQDL